MCMPLITLECNDNVLFIHMQHNGADVNAVDVSGCSPLHLAVAGDVRVVEVLLQHGAHIDAINKEV